MVSDPTALGSGIPSVLVFSSGPPGGSGCVRCSLYVTCTVPGMENVLPCSSNQMNEHKPNEGSGLTVYVRKSNIVFLLEAAERTRSLITGASRPSAFWAVPLVSLTFYSNRLVSGK